MQGKGGGMMIHTDTVHALSSLPATDLNFVSCLKSATNVKGSDEKPLRRHLKDRICKETKFDLRKE